MSIAATQHGPDTAGASHGRQDRVHVTGLASLEPHRHWLYAQGIPQRLETRLAAAGLSIRWLAFRPDRKAHDPYDLVPSGNVIVRPVKKAAWSAKQVAKRVIRRVRFGKPTRRFDRTVPEGQVVRELIADAQSTGAQRLVIVRDDQIALLPEAVDLALRAAPDADVVWCSQLDGLLPIVVRTAWLEQWLERHGDRALERLSHSPSLRASGRVVDLRLVEDADAEGGVRFWPLDERETMLLRYWDEHAGELSAALREEIDNPHPRPRLTALIRAYRSTNAAALATYRATGTFDGIQEVRRQMRTTQKPIVDYFVVATHYVRFLRRFAGLRSASRVLDIGCSWGYLGFALANVLDESGAYLGVEVQEQAVNWAQEHFGWLGDHFRFAHLDIRNDYYNPDGTIARGQVRLPVEDGWADVIVLGSIFTHMQEDGIKGYFREFRRLLSPGGTVAFSYFDSTSRWAGQQSLIGDTRVPDWVTVYSRARIEEMLAEAGLRAARQPVNLRQFDRTEYQTWYFATIDAAATTAAANA